MRQRILIPVLVLLLAAGISGLAHIDDAQAATLANAKTLVLYDAAAGGLPDASLIAFTDFPPGTSSLTYAESAALLDTTLSGGDTYAGWVTSGATVPSFPILDRTAGVQVNFRVQMEREAHTSNNRAGFSVIVLDSEAKGIELGFWENEIWAQNDDRDGLFTHGEGAAFVTSAMTEYQLTLLGDTYTLTANSQPLLTGAVRDYSSFTGFPDPYQTPNFLFLGDDTTSSQARVRLAFVSVTGSEPVVPTVTAPSTITALPLPVVSPSPVASAVPTSVPTPTPGAGFELCPSSWILGFVMLGSVGVSKTLRRRS